MWNKRKLLLAALVFAALYYKVTAKLLDMAPDAVDDLYSGCRREALEKFIYSDLLQEELKHNAGFQKAWNASPHCSKLIPGGIKEHTAALSAFINGDADFIKSFNKEVETLGVNVHTYENQFKFKSLHFLLMDSIKLLYPQKCKTFFALPEETYTAKKGSKVRFGQFTIVHSDYSMLKESEDLDGQVVFNITSCFFANLGDICSDKDTALLSPAEVFTVEEVIAKTDPGETEFTEISLKHLKQDSSHNCYIFSRSPANVSTQCLVLVLVALSCFFF